MWDKTFFSVTQWHSGLSLTSKHQKHIAGFITQLSHSQCLLWICTFQVQNSRQNAYSNNARYSTQHHSMVANVPDNFSISRRLLPVPGLSCRMHISSEKRHIFRCVLTDHEHPISAFHSTEAVLTGFCKRPFTQLTDHLLWWYLEQIV